MSTETGGEKPELGLGLGLIRNLGAIGLPCLAGLKPWERDRGVDLIPISLGTC